MARDPDKPVLRVVDESPTKPQEVVRLTNDEGEVTRSVAVPLAVPLTRLEPEERSTEERRAHEPDHEALVEPEIASMPLEDTWSSESKPTKPMPWGWFVRIGLIFVGGAVWSMTHMERHKDRPESARAQDIETLDQEIKERAEAEATVNRIIQSVRDYCEADTIDKLCAVSRQPDRVRPLMEDWYRKQPLKAAKFDTLDLFQPVTLSNRGNFWMVSCTMKDGGRRHLLVEEAQGGKDLVDWETEVCYQPMDWDQYARERKPGSMDFRVRVEPDNLFSHEFSDSERWACFRLNTLKGEEVLFGYIERQSEEGSKLVKLLEQNGNRESALLLRISTPVDLRSPHGVVIEKVMSPRWTYVDPPDT